MLGNYRVAAQLVASRAVLSSTELDKSEGFQLSVLPSRSLAAVVLQLLPLLNMSSVEVEVT
jgi:hypothetical protein